MTSVTSSICVLTSGNVNIDVLIQDVRSKLINLSLCFLLAECESLLCNPTMHQTPNPVSPRCISCQSKPKLHPARNMCPNLVAVTQCCSPAPNYWATGLIGSGKIGRNSADFATACTHTCGVMNWWSVRLPETKSKHFAFKIKKQCISSASRIRYLIVFCVANLCIDNIICRKFPHKLITFC